MSDPKDELNIKLGLTKTSSSSKIDFINQEKNKLIIKSRRHTFNPNISSHFETPTKSSKNFLMLNKSPKRAENYDHLMNRTNSVLRQQNKKVVLKNPFPLLYVLSNKFVLNNSKNLMTSLLGDHTYLRVMNIKSKIDREKNQPIIIKANLKKKILSRETLSKSENFLSQHNYTTFLTDKSNLQFDNLNIESILQVKKLNVRRISESSNFKTANSTKIEFPDINNEKPKFFKTETNSGLFLTAGKIFQKTSSHENIVEMDKYYTTDQKFYITSKLKNNNLSNIKVVNSQPTSPKKVIHKTQFSMDKNIRVLRHKYNISKS